MSELPNLHGSSGLVDGVSSKKRLGVLQVVNLNPDVSSSKRNSTHSKKPFICGTRRLNPGRAAIDPILSMSSHSMWARAPRLCAVTGQRLRVRKWSRHPDHARARGNGRRFGNLPLGNVRCARGRSNPACHGNALLGLPRAAGTSDAYDVRDISRPCALATFAILLVPQCTLNCLANGPPAGLPQQTSAVHPSRPPSALSVEQRAEAPTPAPKHGLRYLRPLAADVGRKSLFITPVRQPIRRRSGIQMAHRPTLPATWRPGKNDDKSFKNERCELAIQATRLSDRKSERHLIVSEKNSP